MAVLGGFAYIYVTGAVELGADEVLRFALIYLLSLLYISTFFTLGLLISARTHRPSTALLVSLLVWICWILVVPNLAPIVARLTVPVPNRQVIDMEKRQIGEEGRLLVDRYFRRGFTHLKVRKIRRKVEREPYPAPKGQLKPRCYRPAHFETPTAFTEAAA